MQLSFPAAATADICDSDSDARALLSWFQSYGGQERCAGRIPLIDNQASCICAMLGGGLARQASDNGWADGVVNGAVRDSNDFLLTAP